MMRHLTLPQSRVTDCYIDLQFKLNRKGLIISNNPASFKIINQRYNFPQKNHQVILT